MKTLKQLLFATFIFIVSCKQEYQKVDTNVINITKTGDSLETGLWIYSTGKFGISSRGYFNNGLRTGEWIYKFGNDSIKTNWSVINFDKTKFSFPDKYKIIDSNKIDYPLIFQASIDIEDKNTHISLLKHKLEDSHLAAYEYLLFSKEDISKDPNINVKSLKSKKYIFKNIDIYKLQIELFENENYTIISYVFVIDDKLYELVYKNKTSQVTELELELVENILYSMECDGIDLFNYGTSQYSEEQEIKFK